MKQEPNAGIVIKTDAKVVNGRLKLTVTDNGQGMPQDKADKINRGEAVQSSKGDGRGMGVGIMMGVVKKYGGTIHVTPIENEGTIFEIELIPKSEKDKTEQKQVVVTQQGDAARAEVRMKNSFESRVPNSGLGQGGQLGTLNSELETQPRAEGRNKNQSIGELLPENMSLIDDPVLIRASWGSREDIQTSLEEVKSYMKRDARYSRKVWIAFALSFPEAQDAIKKMEPEYHEQAEQLLNYLIEVVQKTKSVVDDGFVRLDPSNIHQFMWGAPAANSSILDRLGIVDKLTGKIVNQKRMSSFGLNPDSRVGERWLVSDDTEFPSWVVMEGFPIPLFWLISQYPRDVLGEKHAEAYRDSLGAVLKYLEVRDNLSLQIHRNISEGFYFLEVSQNAGFFLGLNEPASESQRLMMVKHVVARLKNRDSKVIREPPYKMDHLDGDVLHRLPEVNVDTVADYLLKGDSQATFMLELATQGMFKPTIGHFWINEQSEIGQVVGTLLLDGMHFVDIVGFGLDAQGHLDPAMSLLKFHQPKPDDRFVIRQHTLHALRGVPDQSMLLFEFRDTAAVWPFRRQPEDLTSRQTISLADNVSGRVERPGKVIGEILPQALIYWTDRDGEKPGRYWHRGDERYRRIGRTKGAETMMMFRNWKFYGRSIRLESGAAVKLIRHGQHSAFLVQSGTVEIRDVNGKMLGTAGREEEILISAKKGDLILKATGSEPVQLVEFKRPVPGVPIPEVVSLQRRRAPKSTLLVEWNPRSETRHTEKNNGVIPAGAGIQQLDPHFSAKQRGRIRQRFSGGRGDDNRFEANAARSEARSQLSQDGLSVEEKKIILGSKAKEYKSSTRDSYFNVFGNNYFSPFNSPAVFSGRDQPAVEVNGKDILILPADNNLPFILMKHNPGPNSIIVVDINPATIAWQKALFLHSGKKPLSNLLSEDDFEPLKAAQLVRFYVAKDEAPAPSRKNLMAKVANIVEGLPFPDNSFDSAIVRWLFGAPTGIMSKEQVATAFRELLRVARPGAKILIELSSYDDSSIKILAPGL